MEGRARLKGGEIRGWEVKGREEGEEGPEEGEGGLREGGKKRKFCVRETYSEEGDKGRDGGLPRVHPFRMGVSYPFISQ